MILDGALDRLSIEYRREHRQRLYHQPSDELDKTVICSSIDWEKVEYDNEHESDPHVDGYFEGFEFEDNSSNREDDDDDCVVVSLTKPQRQSRVRFEEDPVREVQVIDVDPFTRPEDIWYTSQEFAQATRDLQLLVQKAREHHLVTPTGELAMDPSETSTSSSSGDEDDKNSNDNDDDFLFLRGLEDVASPEAYRRRYQRTKAVRVGVLAHQRRQTNAEVLGRRSSEASREAQALAHRRASWDATAALLVA